MNNIFYLTFQWKVWERFSKTTFSQEKIARALSQIQMQWSVSEISVISFTYNTCYTSPILLHTSNVHATGRVRVTCSMHAVQHARLVFNMQSLRTACSTMKWSLVWLGAHRPSFRPWRSIVNLCEENYIEHATCTTINNNNLNTSLDLWHVFLWS